MKHFGWGRRWAERAGVKAGIMAGIFLVILGCAGCGEGRQNAQEASSFVPAYQFAPGIIAHSPYPVYVLENESGYSVSRNGVTVELVRGMLQNNEMVAELRILDYRKNRMENDMEASSRSFDMRCFGPGIRPGAHFPELHDPGGRPGDWSVGNTDQLRRGSPGRGAHSGGGDRVAGKCRQQGVPYSGVRP